MSGLRMKGKRAEQMPAFAKADTRTLPGGTTAGKGEDKPIVTPEIGDRLWFYSRRGVNPALFLVSRVHSVYSVTGISVDENGWQAPRQRVFMHHDGAPPEVGAYCKWPERKPTI
jgi:hypothetical protein